MNGIDAIKKLAEAFGKTGNGMGFKIQIHIDQGITNNREDTVAGMSELLYVLKQICDAAKIQPHELIRDSRIIIPGRDF